MAWSDEVWYGVLGSDRPVWSRFGRMWPRFDLARLGLAVRGLRESSSSRSDSLSI